MARRAFSTRPDSSIQAVGLARVDRSRVSDVDLVDASPAERVSLVARYLETDRGGRLVDRGEVAKVTARAFASCGLVSIA